MKKQTEGHPEFANFDDPAASIAGDGQSTGAASGADTPLTASTPGQPKIKLTFNNSNFDSASTLNGTDTGAEEE